VTAANGAGLASAPSSFTLVPDARPPMLTVRCNGKPCVSSAYAGPVVVAFTGADSSGAGLDTIRYSLDGAAPTKDVGLEYTQPLVVRSLAHLKVLAFDKAGNASRPLSLTVRSLADRLVFGAPVRINVAPADHYMKARVSSTARAHVVAVMTGRGLASPQRWRFTLQRGAWIVQLRLPETCRRRTPYTVRWTVSAGTRSAAKVTQVTLR
jgi:hypothetical protein